MRKALLAIILSAPAVALAATVQLTLPWLVNFVVNILIVAGVCWLLLFIVKAWNPPEPFAKFLPAVIYTFSALFLIAILLGGVDMPIVVMR